uniref:Uncharacterized protein n=1 Tax=Cacopsylla melanoneura TaxID=428564 RepID=A0A8D8Y5U9_9HEMI
MKILLVAILCIPLAHSSTASPVNNEATDASSPWLSGLWNFANDIIATPVNNGNDAKDITGSPVNNGKGDTDDSSPWFSGLLNAAYDIIGTPVNKGKDATDDSSPWLSGLSKFANDIIGSTVNNNPSAPSPLLNGVFNFAKEILETAEQSVANELSKRAEKDTPNCANNGVNVKPSINKVPKRKPALDPHPKGANKRLVNFAENESTNMGGYCWDTTVDIDDKREDGVYLTIRRLDKVRRYYYDGLIYPKLTEVFCNDDKGVKITFYYMDMTKKIFWYRP